ncbi:MAG: peptidoglycan-binding protein, partial [Chloroflexaceae bacterium]
MTGPLATNIKFTAANNADGRLEVFARGADNALYHIWQTSPGGAWGTWSRLGGVLTSNPSAVRNADGRLMVFVRGADNALYMIAQKAPNSGW